MDVLTPKGVARRRLLRQAGAAGLAVAAGQGAQILAGAGEGAGQPNILFILADDMRWDVMGCAGHPLIRTPSLDRLATGGVRFTNAFVTTSICAPNRACILSGQHQRTTGIKDFATPFSEEALDRTYPALLRRAGYRTGFLGKWGVGANNEGDLELPASRFDYWRGFPGQGDYFHAAGGKREHLITQITPRQASEFLDGCRPGQPFCLSISLKAPHGPWQDYDPSLAGLYTGADLPTLPGTFTREAFEALPRFLQESLNGRWTLDYFARDRDKTDPDAPRKQVADYFRQITGLDLAIGRILDDLRRRGLEENTVVVFTSDNGYFLYEQGLQGKWLMHEPSIRVPLIVHDPRLPESARGRLREETALTIDVAPTLLALAGVRAPRAMQGRDLGPLLRGERVSWRSDWFYEHTFTLAPPRLIAKTEGVRTERWKYIRYLDRNPHFEQLFDLQSDPGELRNVAAEPACAGILAELRARYQHYRKALPDNNPEPQEYGHFRTVPLSDDVADVPHDFAPKRSLGQTFVAEGERIHSLQVRTPTWGTAAAPCGLVLELLRGGPEGKRIARRVVPRDAVRANRWTEVVLKQAVPLGETLYLRLRPEREIAAHTLGWWSHDEDRYVDGTAFIHDEAQAFDMGLVVTYEDPEGFVPPERKPAPPRTRWRLRQGQQLSGAACPDIAGKAILVTATIEPKGSAGVIVAQGGHGSGYALFLREGRLAMAVRLSGALTLVTAPDRLPPGRSRVAGRLAKDGTITLQVDGKDVASGKAAGLIPAKPGDPLECGADRTTAVGDYAVPNAFAGTIHEAAVQLE